MFAKDAVGNGGGKGGGIGQTCGELITAGQRASKEGSGEFVVDGVTVVLCSLTAGVVVGEW